MAREIFAGNNSIKIEQLPVKGELIELDGENFYKISHYDRMRPFFMTLTSDSDIWMFISSNGGITAGRKNSDQAIFPYYTDDQLMALSESTGSKTIFLVKRGSCLHLWMPFSDQYKGIDEIQRNLYKNSLGNQLIFEEENKDLGLIYRQSWLNSKGFGIVKKSHLINRSTKSQEINLLDGLVSIMPPGILQNVQQTKSNLANAYKKSELLEQSGIGIYGLSSNIIDRPEPSEALKATTVWSAGINAKCYLLSDRQVNLFASGGNVVNEKAMRAEPGAYLINSELNLDPGDEQSWYFCADTNKSAIEIAALEQLIRNSSDLPDTIEADIRVSNLSLKKIIGQADGFQVTSDEKGNLRHISNTLFNVMRGGIFADEYMVEKEDLLDFIRSRNRQAFAAYGKILETLPSKIRIDDLRVKMAKLNNGSLERYAYEYLPITFSRRHGDPSRPWNRFNIDLFQENGDRKKYYEGNWRDIFQNWEALCYSYPGFTENIIAIFLNASTIDGYNPYRITSKGIEWEITDADDPWSFIGYWGDHQIIYLLKLLEISVRFHPNQLEAFLDKPFYTYANVPYRIKDYQKIVENPYDTIVYNEGVEKQIEERVKTNGGDGKLCWHMGEIVKASLTEKLLVTLLTKLSNYVPGGGIWMNTQRPEWNDANNALVGHGLSMVTVYYLRRYVHFLSDFYRESKKEYFEVGVELESFFRTISDILLSKVDQLGDSIDNKNRKLITDQLGKAGEKYRRSVYDEFTGNKTILTKDDLVAFLATALKHLDDTITLNRRGDGLYHAYNLLELHESEYGIKYLYPMLEGQVAILSSGNLKPEESLKVLDALRQSELYREDQNSYILYPDRNLTSFMEKAEIDPALIEGSELLEDLIKGSVHSIIQVDAIGKYHFNPGFSNVNDLKNALNNLNNKLHKKYSEEALNDVMDVYEKVFNHHEFTGRSGTFFGYEGLGSIYWHMNSKLLLAVQENYFSAIENKASEQISHDLKKHYYETKEGLGTHKSPEIYGAFPIDPYSHTPAHKGAQQPGMTGQVKEDLLSRMGELGIKVKDGEIFFETHLLNQEEFLRAPSEFKCIDASGKEKHFSLSSDQLGFTFCGIPVLYTESDVESIKVYYADGKSEEIPANSLDHKLSNLVFQRNKEIDHILVNITS